jgi:hypothetical protein
MSQAVQTAIEVFNSKVLPVLKKWNYEVALVENEPNCACWELRWGDLAAYVETRHTQRTKRTKEATITWGSLLICGGSYCSANDPLRINTKSLFEKFKNAVEAAIIFSCKRELEKVYCGSKGEAVISRIWWGTKKVEWITKDQLYSCTLAVSLSKRQPTWRWVCKSGKFKPYTYCPLDLLCEIKPTDEVVNPTEAFLRFERAILLEALL